eukprot:365252-Chlamydomonas_euryale.AAC.50
MCALHTPRPAPPRTLACPHFPFTLALRRRGGVVDGAHQGLILMLAALGPEELNQVWNYGKCGQGETRQCVSACARCTGARGAQVGIEA